MKAYVNSLGAYISKRSNGIYRYKVKNLRQRKWVRKLISRIRKEANHA